MNESGAVVKFNPPENNYIQLDMKFAAAYGESEAIAFAKLHRLQDNWQGWTDSDGVKWVRLTYEEWEEEIPIWSRNKIIRTLKSLEKKGLAHSTVFDGRSKWYRVEDNYVNLSTQNEQIEEHNNEASTQNEQTHLPKMGRPSTQNEQLPIVPPIVLPKEEAALQILPLINELKSLVGYDKVYLTGPAISELNKATEFLTRAGATVDDIKYFRSSYWWGKTLPSVGQVQKYWSQAMAQKATSVNGNGNGAKKLTEAEAKQNYDFSFTLGGA